MATSCSRGSLLSALLLAWLVAGTLTAEIQVVTTLPAYASIAESVGGDRVAVSAISRADEDAHFVKPKPSFALRLRSADLFVATGLDLEVWVPVLIDKSGNRSIREGARGYVSASAGVPLLDVPATVDRSAGDVHAFGNPHIFTSPINAKAIAANIVRGLQRVDPEGASYYERRLDAFVDRIDRALYGKELVDILGSDSLDSLAREGSLIDFLESKELRGRPLIDSLGGWLGRTRAFRGRPIVAYHKNWIYLTELLGLDVVDFVEPKPGIPPSARHVHRLIETMRDREIRVLLAASYFSAQQIQSIADRTGSRAVRVPLGPSAAGPTDYIAVVDLWIDELTAAFTE